MEWTKLHNVYYQRRRHTANVLGNAIYLFGGYDYNDDKILICNDVQEFDIDTESLAIV